MEYVLVTGTTFASLLPGYGDLRRIAEMTGRSLARSGFGLITGNPPGVDSLAAEAFWAECRRLARDPAAAYRQLWLPHFRRGYWLPGAGFVAPSGCIETLSSSGQWTERAISLASAAVMIGGRSGALAIARRFIEGGKTVLPIPFIEGTARSVFHEILRTWEDAPVPGLRQSQFLRLAIPWLNDSGPDLLFGLLSSATDVFVSYRRSDSALGTGRLYGDLVERFGERRVFMDRHGIAPSAQWLASLDAATAACKIGIVVIGPNWLVEDERGQPRLCDPNDIVRRELRALLDGGKRVLPVLLDGARLPPAGSMPEELRRLLDFQALALDDAGWPEAVKRILAAVAAGISLPASAAAP
jgi:hypothetical protein